MAKTNHEINVNSDAFIHKAHYDFSDLLALVAFLRSDKGCPWDRAQTHESLRTNLIEEAYEGVDAINSQKPARIKDELGDVLLQVVLHAQIAEENGTFDFAAIVDNLCHKLVSRHTHVFAHDKASTAEEGRLTWINNKLREKGLGSAGAYLADLSLGLPGLLYATKLQNRARKFNFDFRDPQSAKAKIAEEMSELDAELESHNATNAEKEAGDLLFAVVNYLRLLGINAEVALSQSSAKFLKRFQQMEMLLSRDNLNIIDDLPLATLDCYWEKAKAAEKSEKKDEN